MFVRLTLFGNLRITFTMARVTDVIGVNSELHDGKHILMLDLDNVSRMRAEEIAYKLIRKYHLPKVYIYRSSNNSDNYHLISMKRLDFRKLVHIATSVEEEDLNHIRWALHRGKFTLRISPKNGTIPALVSIIDSDYPEEASWFDIKSFVQYETLDRRK